MEDEIVNYTLRLRKALHREFKMVALSRDMDLREIFIEGADLWKQKHGAQTPIQDGLIRHESELVELVKDFFKRGNDGQIELFKFALDLHRKKHGLKKPAY